MGRGSSLPAETSALNYRLFFLKQLLDGSALELQDVNKQDELLSVILNGTGIASMNEVVDLDGEPWKVRSRNREWGQFLCATNK